MHHVMILGEWPTWCTNSLLCVYFYLQLYMFWAHSAHHQERQIVSVQPLVTVTLCWWPRCVQVRRRLSLLLNPVHSVLKITDNCHHTNFNIKVYRAFTCSLNALQCSEKCDCRFFSSEVNTPISAGLELMLCVQCDVASFHALYFITSNIIITQILLLKHKQINNSLF